MRCHQILLILAASAALFAQKPKLNAEGKALRKLTTLERIEPQHLEAVAKARAAFAAARKAPPAFSIYNDYRTVMHVHAEDAEHTQGTRAQVLAAAKIAQVNAVLSTDHRGPKPESWSGLHDGVLFIQGSEDGEKHQLRYPSPEGDFLVISHLEEVPAKSSAGYKGLEIYNRHADAKDEPEFYKYFEAAMKDPAQWASLVERQMKYPAEMFGAHQDYWPELLERWDKETLTGPFTGIAANDAHRNQVYKGTVFDPYEIAFRDVSTHVLARELTEPVIRQSLTEGRAYVSFDWLCDPTGFYFSVSNNLGVYEMGDRIPHTGNARLYAALPIPAHWKIIHNGKQIAEGIGDQVNHAVKQLGTYRLEAWLTVDGEERPWILANPVFVREPLPSETHMPPPAISENVEARKGIEYTTGAPEDSAKHKLDVYLPKGIQKAPVLFFIHGGSWRSGDRSLYPAFANRFAKEGAVVVVPSYRLAPKYAHPAQIEDVAAAFDWTVKHAAEFGGDPTRITIMGQSAGGHLVSLLATDESFLAKRGLSLSNIHKVISMSGVYQINEGFESVFGADKQQRRLAAAGAHVKSGLPPFLVLYSQFDYLTLPLQAREFHSSLLKAGVASKLIYIPGENHISEVVRAIRDEDPSARQIVDALLDK